MTACATRSDNQWIWIGARVCGILAMGVAAALIAPRPLALLAIAAGILCLTFLILALREPSAFVLTFLVVLVVLPPFFFPQFGETPVYFSYFLLPIGLAIIVARLPDLRFPPDAAGRGLGVFLATTGLSLPFAFWLSGTAVGIQSFFRWLLLAQTGLIYCLTRGGARRDGSRCSRRFFPVLLAATVVSGAYGIIDFVWPIPLPHPAADQFIWLGSSVLRRAQGVFYESSNFANLCGFFQAAASAAYLARAERLLGVPRPWLLVAICVLSLAVLVAFSRSAWANVLATVVVFMMVSRGVRLLRASVCLAALGLPLALLWTYSPELWDYFLSARVGYLAQMFVDPNLASSERFDTWVRVVAILGDHPQYLVFGVGYKTLPFTRLFHGEMITDNGYLNLLLETGVVGLGGFLVFAAGTLKACFSLARSPEPRQAFWGALLFSFWIGQCVQMMAADAYTYWRNMVVYAALLAYAQNLASREWLETSGRNGEDGGNSSRHEDR